MSKSKSQCPQKFLHYKKLVSWSPGFKPHQIQLKKFFFFLIFLHIFKKFQGSPQSLQSVLGNFRPLFAFKKWISNGIFVNKLALNVNKQNTWFRKYKGDIHKPHRPFYGPIYPHSPLYEVLLALHQYFSSLCIEQASLRSTQFRSACGLMVALLLVMMKNTKIVGKV